MALIVLAMCETLETIFLRKKPEKTQSKSNFL